MRPSSTLSTLALAASAFAKAKDCRQVTPYGDAVTGFRTVSECGAWRWQSDHPSTVVNINKEDCQLTQAWPNSKPLSYVCIEPPQGKKQCFKTPGDVDEPCTIPPSHCNTNIENMWGWSN